MAGWKDILTSKEFLHRTGAVFAGEVISSIGAIAFTPLLDKFLHSKNNIFRKKVADWIEPHVKEIEKSAFSKELHALGEEEGKKETSYHTLAKRGRAERIADILLQNGTLFLAENGLSVGVQQLFKSLDSELKNDKDFKPLENGMAGAATHLGCIVLFGTILEKPTEWVYRKLAKVLQKVGMKEDAALRSASSMTFIAGPGLIAFLAEALWTNRPSLKK